MKPAIRAILESKGIVPRCVHHAPSPAELAARAPEKCSSCPCAYVPAPGADPADHRCGRCKAKARRQDADPAPPPNLASRAEVRIDRQWSSFDGWSGIGRRVVVSGHLGWMVRLDREPERELFFGAAAVRIERSLLPLPEGPRALQARKRDPMCEAAARSAEIKRQATRKAREGAK